MNLKIRGREFLARIGLSSLILLSSCSDVKPGKSVLVKPVIQERREVLPPGGCIDNIEALSLAIQHMELMLSGEKVEADQLAFSFSRESFFGVDYISVAVGSKGRVQIIIDVECTGDSILNVRSPEESEY